MRHRLTAHYVYARVEPPCQSCTLCKLGNKNSIKFQGHNVKWQGSINQKKIKKKNQSRRRKPKREATTTRTTATTMAATGVEQNCDMLRCRYDFDARFNYNFDANCLNTHARTTITHVPVCVFVCVCCCCIACTNCLRQQRIEGRRRDKERRSTEKQALHTPRA